MKYPIDYIEGNIMRTITGEWFAYYEMMPYGYSFRSEDEKSQIAFDFSRMISQYPEGRIHALQISTETSIREAMERSKKWVSGPLKDRALVHIDALTEALCTEILGRDTEVDYRYIIGFKLIPRSQEVAIKRMAEEAWQALSDLVREFNHTVAGDFVTVSNAEIRRYAKIEELLYGRISQSFSMRRLKESDFGYVISHLCGQTGVPYEQYEYALPKKQLEDKTVVKYHDLIEPASTTIRERQRSLQIDTEQGTCYTACFAIKKMTSDLAFPGCEVFYGQQRLGFPIDTSMNVSVVPNRNALTRVRNKKKDLEDQEENAHSAGNRASGDVYDALKAVEELEDTLTQTRACMYELSYIVRTTASTEKELEQRCNEILDYYDRLNIKLVRPFGDMMGMHNEFFPGSRRYRSDYIQHVSADFLAVLGFGATQVLGEKDGIYVGYNTETQRSVYLVPWLAAQGVEGSVTNALAKLFTGSLGGGKSVAENLLTFYTVLFGGKVLLLDPKSERGNWAKDLPELEGALNIVNLKGNEENRGLLDPYVIVNNPSKAEALAMEILPYMLGLRPRDTGFAVLQRAMARVSQREKRGLLMVIDELRVEDTELSNGLAYHISTFTNYSIAKLLFSDGNVHNAVSLEYQLNVLQIADLVLPEKDTAPEDYTAEEVLSVAVLMAISNFAMNFVNSGRKTYKVAVMDEAWAILRAAKGKAMGNKLLRAGRSMNSGVDFVTQQTGDLPDEDAKNLIGLRFAFRSTDLREIKQTLAFFDVDPEDEYNQERLKGLRNGECLFRDLYGNVGILKIHPVFEYLLNAFDTRPPMGGEEGDDQEWEG